jgi:hypothetical protein
LHRLVPDRGECGFRDFRRARHGCRFGFAAVVLATLAALA